MTLFQRSLASCLQTKPGTSQALRNVHGDCQNRRDLYFNLSKNFATVALCVAMTSTGWAQSAAASDQEIPPAVAKQLEAMQKRIEDLERELGNRPRNRNRLRMEQRLGRRAHARGNSAESHPGISEGLQLPQSDPSAKPAIFKRRFHLAERRSRVKGSTLRHEILHAGDPLRCRYAYSTTIPRTTRSGSAEVFRHNEFQLTQLGVGGDFTGTML